MAATFEKPDQNAIPIHVLTPKELPDWLTTRSEIERNWIDATGFSAKLGQICRVPAEDGTMGLVLFGYGDQAARKRGRLHVGALPRKLQQGTYRLAGDFGDPDLAALSWLLGSYRFARYKGHETKKTAALIPPPDVDAARIEAVAEAAALTCDLINTPANDMGPDALETAFGQVAERFSADWTSIRGEDLLARNFPMIHAVGRASDQQPRLLDLRWGQAGNPTVTIVGKGVCFDTGGLNLKPGRSMALMKKDMGGGATAIGLAQMIMALNLPVRLRLLVPAVENSVSAGAFRPGDVLTSRKGLTVEINNTDAEGRLVLADALALAAEEKPQFMVSLATLTGAARVALGTDIQPFFSDDEDWADAIFEAGQKVADPLWRMPFWDPYEGQIEPAIAHLDNAPSGGMGGAITAALFLRRFAEGAEAYAHFDIYGWTPSARPGRPAGGACMGARALLSAIETRFGAA